MMRCHGNESSIMLCGKCEPTVKPKRLWGETEKAVKKHVTLKQRIGIVLVFLTVHVVFFYVNCR
ncbi:hypothetical protein B566_EDAN003644 [Ephemera danica]|nr:hypothetical protein B566_EDAN003644 [Ephemera danica]